MKKIEYKTILVAHDGSELASSALPHALSLALSCNADIFLLQVIPSASMKSVYVTPGSVPVIDEVTTQKIIEKEKRIARNHLERIKIEFEKGGVYSVESYVSEGSAESVIINFAKSYKCDLIVMSTHGRSGLGRTLLGSVTDHVIRHASCPVLVIHPRPKED